MQNENVRAFRQAHQPGTRAGVKPRVHYGRAFCPSILGLLLLSAFACGGELGLASSDTGRRGHVLAPRLSNGASADPFDEVTVLIDFEVDGNGYNIDTIAFWEAPDPGDSLMFVTSKGSNLVEVWQYPFSGPDDERPSLTHSCLENGTNGVEIDQEEDRLYVSVTYSQNICVFSLPDLAHLDTFDTGPVLGHEPNLAWLKLTNGLRRLYVSDNDEKVVYIWDAMDGTLIDHFTPTQGVEDFVGDGYYPLLYLPDEHDRTGIYPYEPDGSPYEQEGRRRFGEGVFEYDAEGILIYACPADGSGDNGQGLIVVSDQVLDQESGNDYEVFDRQTWEYLGKIKLRDEQGQFVYNTDGISSIQQPSAAYPLGVFAAINNDATTVGVGWEKIFAATGWRCEALTPTVTPAPTEEPPATCPSEMIAGEYEFGALSLVGEPLGSSVQASITLVRTGVVEAHLNYSVYDTDCADEGDVYLNGTKVADVPMTGDMTARAFTTAIDPLHLVNGINQLVYAIASDCGVGTDGYRIEGGDLLVCRAYPAIYLPVMMR